VTALTRPLVLAVLLLGLIVLAGPTLLRHAPDIGERIDATANNGGGEQSASQISAGEFGEIQPGTTPDQLGSFVGEPASKSSATVEGIELECWYYGIVGATGAYQLCFKDGQLTSKQRFTRD
jgi:hypothetical protein